MLALIFLTLFYFQHLNIPFTVLANLSENYSIISANYANVCEIVNYADAFQIEFISDSDRGDTTPGVRETRKRWDARGG